MHRFLYIGIVLGTLIGCDYLEPKSTKEPIARVNDTYLYVEDIQELTTNTTSRADSISIVSNYIQRWATQQLLINKANINLPQEQISIYERMVEDYKNDLFSEAYKGVIVSKQLDSTVTEEAYLSFYESYKENFTLKEEIFRLRYVHVDKNYTDISETKEKLRRFNIEDKVALDSISLQFKGANFNDSIWVKKEALLKQLPLIRNNETRVLKNATFTQLEDSLGVYLLKIEAVLSVNEIAPLDYIKPTITEIILNKRTLDLIKELEKDITKDAIKNKNFEIYTPK